MFDVATAAVSLARMRLGVRDQLTASVKYELRRYDCPAHDGSLLRGDRAYDVLGPHLARVRVFSISRDGYPAICRRKASFHDT